VSQINQILETALYVKDIEVAEQFYRDVFGFQTYSKGGTRHLFFKIGNSMLLLFNAEETKTSDDVPPHGTVGQGHVAFAVEHHELDFWRKRLREKNIEIEQEITWPSGGKSIYFRDPDGNSLELATPDTWP
jgi:catechol 2,3-dioxygenase-like lactoylglutathione lyase family enzyme